MRTSKHRQPSTRQRAAKPGARRAFALTATILLVMGIVAVVVLLRGGELAGMGSPQPSSATPGVHPTAVPIAATSGFQTLHGRWLRPDGGYILDIRDVGANGTIEAVYLNPRPINIARAEARRDNSTLNVFVELRAPGYPGSTYTLTYNSTRDQLEGIYFQAALQQRFNVVFVRMK